MRIFLTSLFLLIATVCAAANYPLEIINIKPAGTGTPAIPSTNRIFHAYPGAEYSIRPAVFGGLYPFTFSLSGEPSGMTIDSHTGEISWTPATAQTTGTITVSVTDAENTTATASWVITVATTQFIFVDASYSGTETGSIAQPYSSIQNMITNTSGQSGKIVYFRAGSYTWYANNGTEMNLNGLPYTWLRYNDEAVTMDGNHVNMRAWGTPLYMDGFTASNFMNWAFRTSGGSNYNTLRRLTLSDNTYDTSTNENQGFMQQGSSDTWGYGYVVQDCDFSNFAGTDGIGSLYDLSYVIIEDNYIHDGGQIGGSSWVSVPIGTKQGIQYAAIRHNRIILPTDAATQGQEFYGGISTESGNFDISFNFFKHSDTAKNAIGFQYALLAGVNIYRNTFVGRFYMINASEPSYGGPFAIYNNVIVNDDSGGVFYNSYSATQDTTWTDNLIAGYSAGVVDTSGYLTASYSSYLGTTGWETGTVSNYSPTATITTPTSSPTYSTSTAVITVGGTTYDSDGTVTSVTFTATGCTPSSGTATGTTTWSYTTTCTEGVNVHTATAHDDQAATGSDTLTSTYSAVGGGATGWITYGTGRISYGTGRITP